MKKMLRRGICSALLLLLILTAGNLFSQCSGTLITPAANMTIASNSYATSGTFTGTLTINSGVTLCLSGTAAISVTDLTVNGILNHTSSGVFAITDYVTNAGTITATNSAVTFNYDGGTPNTLTNNAGKTITIAGNIIMQGDIENSGTIQTTGGTFTHTSTSKFIHNNTGGIIASYGDIYMEGTIVSCGSIQITNSGRLINTGTADDLTNSAGSTIYIKGSGLTSQIESQFYNHGRVIIEGNVTSSQTADQLINYSDGYIRVCGDFTYAQDFHNYGTFEILGQYRNTNSSDVVNNYAGGVWNVSDDVDLSTSLINEGCLTIGDSLWKRNNSSEDVTIRNGGTVFAVNFVQDDGSLIGGSSSANRGYLRVSGLSKTLNTVGLTPYLDLTDEGHIGSSPYFDNESPAYTYPTANITDGGTAPCTKATFTTCGAAWPSVSGACGTFLPVQLLYFSARCVSEEKTWITWSTATEMNNDYFIVERSTDGSSYEEIGRQSGAGNSNTTRQYEFYDDRMETLNKAHVYYRLKQTDYDGKHEYFGPIAVNADCGDGISIYPSLTNGTVYVRAGQHQPGCVITVTDALGRNVVSETLPNEWTEKTIHLNQDAKGVYFLSIPTEKEVIVRKIVVQ